MSSGKRTIALFCLLLAVLLLLGPLVDLFMQPILQGEYPTTFYRGKKLPDHYLRGNLIPLGRVKTSDRESLLWKKFAIGDYLVPLPYRHPRYGPSFRPHQDRNGSITFEVNYLGLHGKHLLSFKLLEKRDFAVLSQGQMLFTLPTAKQWIEQWTLPHIWQDLFAQDISIGPFGFHWWNRRKLLKKFYFAHLRTQIFPQDGAVPLFFPDNSIGLIPREQNREGYRVERVFLHGGPSIFIFQMSYRSGNRDALDIRSQILRQLSYQKRDPQLARVILKELQSLSPAQQASVQGMLYLISAWSQNQENRELLQKAITFLERGRVKLAHLGPLYQFARERYGTDFSSRSKHQKQGGNPDQSGRHIQGEFDEAQEWQPLKERDALYLD